MEVKHFFRASYCKLVFQVDSRNEWLGLDDGERLVNAICSEYDYSECYKDTYKKFYAYDDMDAYRTRWAYCTWITGLPGQLPAAGQQQGSRAVALAGHSMLNAQNKAVCTDLGEDGILSGKLNGTRFNGTITSKLN
ncbi:hypothetical protein SLS64_001303 [Diaporthe eres]